MRSIIFIILSLITINCFAQPYVDPFHARYTYASKTNNGNGAPYGHLLIGPDLPLKLRKGKYFVISPIIEQWNIDSASNKSYLPSVKGIALAMSAVLPLDTDHWTLTASVIPRVNGKDLDVSSDFQFGGVALATYKKKENLKYKFGVYVNTEFFGIFIIPLAGIDWHIDDRNNLFGVLPGRLTFEHKLSPRFYTGGTFRAITNSYHIDNNARYIRIDDNQLSGFLDCYLTKHIVLTSEAGYGILRKLRSGTQANKHYDIDYNWGDGTFVKVAASYRIRL